MARPIAQIHGVSFMLGWMVSLALTLVPLVVVDGGWFILILIAVLLVQIKCLHGSETSFTEVTHYLQDRIVMIKHTKGMINDIRGRQMSVEEKTAVIACLHELEAELDSAIVSAQIKLSCNPIYRFQAWLGCR